MRLLQTLAVFMAAIIALLPLAAVPVAEAEAATPRYNHKHIKHHPNHKPGTPYDHPHSRHHTPKPPPPPPDPDPEPEPEPEPEPGPPNLVIVDMAQFGATLTRTTWTIRASEPVEFYCDHEFARSISEENYQPCGTGTETTYSLPRDQIPVAGASPKPVTLIFKAVDADGEFAERTYFYYVRLA